MLFITVMHFITLQ